MKTLLLCLMLALLPPAVIESPPLTAETAVEAPMPTAETAVEAPAPEAGELPAAGEDAPAAVPEATPSPEPSAICRLLRQYPACYPVDMAGYYLEEMCRAAADGNVRAGRAAEQSRALALEAGGGGESVSFDDLYLLARVIESEAGSDWLSDEFRICVGEVVLNRVESPEFPDTLHDVVYQRGQYSVVNTARFASLAPRAECVDAALRLLQGERRMVPAVVYQSDSLQGELFTVYYDRRLGTTYFCLSNRLELYT